MAKANQFHRAGNTFRHVNYIKIPRDKRLNNKAKWKNRDEIKKEVKQTSKWWERKKGRK